ncbi:MAG: hypothetical protein OJF49_003789 [Ktedonobacterales bacterium]|jgi:tetratricopeptide (TPR) repeat protein|nr:MAG: hypothetical protein OJF49_003789 [Ktedonobacterales bacterium]
MGTYDTDGALGADTSSALDPLMRSSLDSMMSMPVASGQLPVASPCSGWEHLVATRDPEDLAPDEQCALKAHLAECETCRTARLMYLVVDDLIVHSASESLPDVLESLSPIALTALREHLCSEALPLDDSPAFSEALPQDGSPAFSPELLEVWDAEALRAIPPEVLANWVREAPRTISPQLQALWDEEDRIAEAQRHATDVKPPVVATTPPPKIVTPTSVPAPSRQMQSALNVPDDAQSHLDADYSLAIAQSLRQAYFAIKEGNYVLAGQLAQHNMNGLMSARQRMRMYYVSAVAASALSAYRDAMNWLDEAQDIACVLGDVGALAELAFQSGVANGAVQNCGAAAEYFDIALDSVRTLSEEGEPVDPSFELHTLTLLAHYLFVLGKYEQVTDHITEARRLVQLVPESQLQAASIEWLAALLYRWSGQPDRALRYALAAAKVYSDLAPGAETVHDAKLRSVVAECALDIAESLAANEQPEQGQVFVRLAQPYVQQSLAIARNALSESDAESEAVRGLLLLTSFRFERLAGERANHTAKYEQIERVGRKIGDSSLLCQTYTALGQEWASRGERESALSCYRYAMEAQSRGDAVVWGVWARRGLLLDAEMHVS